MNLQQIEISLQSTDLQERIRAITALRSYDSQVSVPLLCQQLNDSDSVIRSIVAASLGKKRTRASFETLLELLQIDPEANVRAEAANSLSLFGRVSASHLVETFFRDDHWLVRRSILAALVEMECPEEVLEVCGFGLEGDDAAVQEASVDGLGALANSRQSEATHFQNFSVS